MDEDKTPSGLRRVEPDVITRAHDNINGQYAAPGVSSGRTRGGVSDAIRASNADASARRDGSR